MTHYTAAIGNNTDIFKGILELYVSKGAKVADVTYGTGAFWRSVNKDDYELSATDIKEEYGGIDFRRLPYDDESFDALVIDPPYMHSPGKTQTPSARTSYRNRDTALRISDIITLYAEGFNEAWRVLRRDGILIVKCQDTVSAGRQILVHIELHSILEEMGFVPEDLFVVVQRNKPPLDPKWKKQYHARKNHSYFMVYRKPRLRRHIALGKRMRDNGKTIAQTKPMI